MDFDDREDDGEKIREMISVQMEQVSTIYESSHTIRSACDILHNSVSDPGFTSSAIESVLHFVRDCIRCLFLYGFFVYKVTKKRSRDQSESIVFAVDHNNITLEFSKGEWFPVFKEETKSQASKVRMLMWRRPSLDFGLDSPAHAGLRPAERLEEILHNIRTRDALNSRRALYTSFEEMQPTSSGKPWFSGASAQGYTGLYGFGASQELDVDDLISNREEMHMRLGSMTKALQSQQFAGMPAGSSFVSLLPSIQDTDHKEFMITDGSKGLFQAAHLAGENDTRGLIRTLQIDTYTATGTPPQAAGVNSNTERVAGSERITNFALDSFDRRCKELRELINPVIEELFGVNFDEYLDVTKFARILPILTEGAAVHLAAKTYKIQEKDIDASRLESMRDSLLYGQATKAQVGAPIAPKNKGNDNAAKDDLQKQEDRKAREEERALE